MHKLAPAYLQQLFTPRHAKYNLRSVEGNLELPKPRTNYSKRGFSFRKALLWSNLPQEWLRNAGSTKQFKQKINQILDI